MKAASKVFEKELSGRWAEGVPRVDGRCYIIVEDQDEDALLILLTILHRQRSYVPQQINLETLVMLALLVDYNDCWKSLEDCPALWIRGLLGPDIRRDYKSRPDEKDFGCNDMLWLRVACVFRQPVLFLEVTRVLILKGTHSSYPTYELPIPKVVSGKRFSKKADISYISKRRRRLTFNKQYVQATTLHPGELRQQCIPPRRRHHADSPHSSRHRES